MQFTPLTIDDREAIPHGTLQIFELEMRPYPDARRRRIRVWLPEEYNGVTRFPVLYMHDGQALFRGEDDRTKWDCDRTVTALAGEGLACIIVGIDSAETRGEELTPPYPLSGRAMVNGQPLPFVAMERTSDTYAEFVVSCLKPLIDANYCTLPDPAHTGIGGASAGGSQSYYMALRNPEVFGRALICSPGFPLLDIEAILAELDSYDMTRLAGSRFYFYNGDQMIDATSVDDVLAVYRRLRQRGLDASQNMFLFDSREGHYDAAWARIFPDALRWLFAEDNLRRP